MSRKPVKRVAVQVTDPQTLSLHLKQFRTFSDLFDFESDWISIADESQTVQEIQIHFNKKQVWGNELIVTINLKQKSDQPTADSFVILFKKLERLYQLKEAFSACRGNKFTLSAKRAYEKFFAVDGSLDIVLKMSANLSFVVLRRKVTPSNSVPPSRVSLLPSRPPSTSSAPRLSRPSSVTGAIAKERTRAPSFSSVKVTEKVKAEDLKKKVQELENKVKEKDCVIKKLQDENVLLREELTIDKELRELEHSQANISTNDDLSDTVTRLEHEINEHKQTIAEQDKQIQNYKKSTRLSLIERTRLTKTIESLREDIAKLQKQIKSLEIEKITLDNLVTNYMKENESLRMSNSTNIVVDHEQLRNITLVAGNKSITVNRQLLVEESPIFAEMLTRKNGDTLEVSEVDFDTMKLLVDAMSGRQVQLTTSNALRLRVISHYVTAAAA